MSRLTKLAAAAAIIVAVALSITVVDKLASPAYAIEQTIEAFKNVRFMHIVQRDKAGNIEDERWIEIGPDGFQARYRQDTPERSFFVVDDRQTVLVHYEDKNTVVLYDPIDKSWTWHYAPGKLFQELAAGGPNYYTVEENVQYKGRPAHHLRWIIGETDIYIDPGTKLPIAHGDYEINYEDPPEGTFDIVIPDGVILVDKRPGAEPTQEPQWMIEEKREAKRKEEMGTVAQGYFEDARRALARTDYVKAIELFSKVIEIQPRRNWALFWMARAHYELGEYDLAIWKFSKVIDMFRKNDWDASYCHLARGLAFQAKDMDEMAQRDMQKALPVMIDALRNVRDAKSFDYADDPLYRSLPKDERPTAEQSLVMMINRLRSVTGQNFGYDPNASTEENEQAISAWEQWYQNSAQFKFVPVTEQTEK